MTQSIAATTEYGIVIRRQALDKLGINAEQVCEIMEDQPLGSNPDLISFGPSFGNEALEELIARLKAVGLEYVDDFAALALDIPDWLAVRVELRNL
jgi:hypothetical protein